MSNFDPNAILRGFVDQTYTSMPSLIFTQRSIDSSHRALQNPALFKHEHYRQAALAVAVGIIIQAIVSMPLIIVRFSFWGLGFFTDLQGATWDDEIINALHFIQHSVLQVPFFLMNVLKFLNPALDNMFMESLQWVDQTYVAKHQSEDPSHLRAMYYPTLRQWHGDPSQKKTSREAFMGFLIRYGKKAGLSLSVLLLSYVPYVGKIVMPALSFYYFRTAVGPKPAIAIFASGLVIPRHYLVRFLQTYFSSRTMMRELLQPYFSRVPFNSEQKRKWFRDREGVLFGFGAAFFVMIKVPLVGVLVYGIAEASTAFLLTKITDPPPPPTDPREKSAYVESQVRWKNKEKFFTLDMANLDSLNVATSATAQKSGEPTVPTKKFS
ncbi:MAG: hypothetical protein Q9159_001764 [Coniocarpon cinnabarinum]